jgi:hypothetical protein
MNLLFTLKLSETNTKMRTAATFNPLIYKNTSPVMYIIREFMVYFSNEFH